MADGGGGIEALESRTLLSGAIAASVAAPRSGAHPAASATRNYVLGFYGLGGASFGNSWLAATAQAIGGGVGATPVLYQQDQGQQAVTDFFKFVDRNGDHILTAAEIDNVNVQAIGYSFGAVQASEFTRSLTATSRRGLYGYRLATFVPVQTLITIDPVNTQPGKHTDGPLSNVAQFLNFYELNPGGTTIPLTVRGTRRSGGAAPFNSSNIIGGLLPSAAQSSSQTLVDHGGPLTNVYVTQSFSHFTYGTLKGGDVNHMTMPWYLYSTILSDLGL